MATSKCVRAAPQRDVAGDPRTDLLPGASDKTDIKSTFDLQAQRALWLARRYRLAPSIASAVADLAFNTSGGAK